MKCGVVNCVNNLSLPRALLQSLDTRAQNEIEILKKFKHKREGKIEEKTNACPQVVL